MRHDTLRRTALARGAVLLALDAVDRVTRIVEAMHANVAATAPLLGRSADGRLRGTGGGWDGRARGTGGGWDGRARGRSGLVYATVRGVNGAVRAGLDRGLAALPAGPPLRSLPRSEAFSSALNGVLGDHLAASRNPLAIPMQLRHGGRRLRVTGPAVAAALPDARRRLLLLVHGLCMNDRQWQRKGHDHGAALASALDATPLYLLYNSGRRVSENGRELSTLLERLVARWPVPLDEIVILAHSMGGLVARSACLHAEAAGDVWRRRLGSIVFLGTPHHGAPLERLGRCVEGALGWSPYTAPLARVGMVRSAGITDLRHGSVHPADPDGRDRAAPGGDRRVLVPLPAGVACYAVAASLGRGSLDPKHLVGDGLVPVGSALGSHADPARTLLFPGERRWIAPGTSHLDLLSSPLVTAKLLDWLA